MSIACVAVWAALSRLPAASLALGDAYEVEVAFAVEVLGEFVHALGEHAFGGAVVLADLVDGCSGLCGK